MITDYITNGYLRYDIDEPEDAYDVYLDLVDELKLVNLMFVDVQLEHDCVTGEVERTSNERTT